MANSNIRLVAIDLDGTLLNRYHEITPRTKEAVSRLKQKGIYVVLASGRPLKSIQAYANLLELNTPIISANGALVYDPVKGQTLTSTFLDPQKVRPIIDYGLQQRHDISIYYEHKVVTNSKRMVNVHWSLEKVDAVYSESLDMEAAILKIIYSDVPHRIEYAYNVLKSSYNEALYITQSGDNFLDFMNKSVSKGRALEKVMAHFKLPKEEVATIGNSYNDLAMFKVSNLPIAMGDAPDEVKKASKHITLSSDQDGVAIFLESLE